MNSSVRFAVFVAASILALGCAKQTEGDPPIEPEDPRPTTLTLSPSSLSFTSLGATSTLTATVKDQFGATMAGQSVLWISNDDQVASVDQTGRVTSVGNGTARVRAQVGLARDTVDVEVAQAPYNILTLAGDGQTHWTGYGLRDTLVVRVQDQAGTAVPQAPVTWEISTGGGLLLILSPTTDSMGHSKAFWVLGPGETGTQLASVSAEGVPPVYFQASGLAPIYVFNQGPLTGMMLDTIDVVLIAQDSLGLPQSGIAVEVADISGFGEIVQGPTTTDINGRLIMEWILGPTSGAQTLVVERADIDRLLTVEAEGTGTIDPWPLTSVSTGQDHTCGIFDDGSAHCWGEGDNSQLGTGLEGSTTVPTAISSLLTWSEIASGRDHTCALAAADGAIYCWGEGLQTGQEIDDTYPTPLVVPGGPWLSVTSGQLHTCAVAQDESGYCWGEGGEGRLGNDASDSTGVPVLVSGGFGWSELSAGRAHTCGVASDQRGYCWGRGAEGQLGSGGTDSLSAPLDPVAGGWRWQSISAGWSHTCGVTTSGDALCWGEGGSNQLGNGSTADQTSPVRVAGDRQWIAVAAGRFHSCGIDTEKLLYCWGRREDIGIGPSASSTPALVVPEVEFESVMTKARHTCAMTSDGRTFCWGQNGDGQLGIGNTENFDIPRLLVRSVFNP